MQKKQSMIQNNNDHRDPGPGAIMAIKLNLASVRLEEASAGCTLLYHHDVGITSFVTQALPLREDDFDGDNKKNKSINHHDVDIIGSKKTGTCQITL